MKGVERALRGTISVPELIDKTVLDYDSKATANIKEEDYPIFSINDKTIRNISTLQGAGSLAETSKQKIGAIETVMSSEMTSPGEDLRSREFSLQKNNQTQKKDVNPLLIYEDNNNTRKESCAYNEIVTQGSIVNIHDTKGSKQHSSTGKPTPNEDSDRDSNTYQIH